MKKLLFIIVSALILTACGSNQKIEELTKENDALTQQIASLEANQITLESKLSELENKPISDIIMENFNHYNFQDFASSLGGIYVLSINNLPERVFIFFPEREISHSWTSYSTILEGTVYIFNSHLMPRYRNAEEKASAEIENSLVKAYKFHYHYNSEESELNNENRIDLFHNENSLDYYTIVIDDKGDITLTYPQEHLFWAKFLYQKEIYMGDVVLKKMGNASSVQTTEGERIILY